MPFIDLKTNFLKKEGRYYVEIHNMFGFLRVANAIWHPETGFETVDDHLAPEEFIKTWWSEY